MYCIEQSYSNDWISSLNKINKSIKPPVVYFSFSFFISPLVFFLKRIGAVDRAEFLLFYVHYMEKATSYQSPCRNTNLKTTEAEPPWFTIVHSLWTILLFPLIVLTVQKCLEQFRRFVTFTAFKKIITNVLKSPKTSSKSNKATRSVNYVMES